MEFDARMEPRPIGAEEKLAWSAALDRLHQIAELTNPRCIRINVGIPRQLIGDLLMRLPIIGETAEMGQDEIHVRVFRCKHVHHLWTADNVYQDREAERPGRFAYLAGGHAIEPMHLHSSKAPAGYRVFHHLENSAGIAL